jgi:hypothetical protein
MQHAAVGDVLAFEPQLADVACAGFAAALDAIVVDEGLDLSAARLV